MKELKDIIRAYDQAVLQEKRSALATVVQVEGSSYRRPGARMLITEDGAITGAISGGCLEGDALRKAQRAMHLGQNKLVVYDTIHEEDQRLGIQLGCNGIVYILLEPILPEDPNNPVELLKKVARDRKEAVVVTGFHPDKSKLQTGTCMVMQAEESAITANQQWTNDLAMVLNQQESLVKAYPDQSMLYQYVPPNLHLVMVGAGNDAQPLMEMASLMGWNITVMDGRPAYATLQRFPKANQILLRKTADFLSAIPMDAQTAVVLMTHNYNYDLAALEALMQSPCGYIGLLGPKQKLEKMLGDLRRKGLEPDPEMLAKLHGPVGLDIGAETAEEIALSIMAEIKAVFSKRRGTSLKHRSVEIHERSFHAQHA